MVRLWGISHMKHPGLAQRRLTLFEISCMPEASKLDSTWYYCDHISA